MTSRGASSTHRADTPGMFAEVQSINDFARTLGVPEKFIALVTSKDSSFYNSKNCPHNAIERNGGYCPAHKRGLYPLKNSRGEDMHRPEFLCNNHRDCDCDQDSCKAAGYFHFQGALCILTARYDTVVNTPRLLSSETKKKITNKEKRNVYLYPWLQYDGGDL